ncbi:MAG TPA: hypothetical protein VKN63_07935 [Afifellaceae bacterium]|nr:hypothetical protein [Afifellaceae bacterium]
MPGGGDISGRPVRWDIVGSLALHIALAVAILLMPPPRPKTPQPQEGIVVEILSPGQFGRLNGRPRLGFDSPAGDHAGEALPAQLGGLVAGTAQAPPAMIHATQFLAARSLANPASRQARLALLQLADEDRMEQLCAV